MTNKLKNRSAPARLQILSPHVLETCRAKLIVQHRMPTEPGGSGYRVLLGEIDPNTLWFTVERLRGADPGAEPHVTGVITGRIIRTAIDQTLIKGIVRLPVWRVPMMAVGGLGLLLVVLSLVIIGGLIGGAGVLVIATLTGGVITWLERERIGPERAELVHRMRSWLDA